MFVYVVVTRKERPAESEWNPEKEGRLPERAGSGWVPGAIWLRLQASYIVKHLRSINLAHLIAVG